MMRKYYVTFSERNLTGNAGLVHLGRFAEKLGIHKILDRTLTIQRGPNRCGNKIWTRPGP